MPLRVKESPMPVDALSVPVSEYDHVRGNVDARFTLLEYGDYECPDCEHAAPIVNRLREQFGQTMRFVFRHFPQATIHPHASTAAQAAEAAGAQRRFWDMHDILFKHQHDLIDHDITHFAVLIGLELYRFEAELGSERFARRVREDYQSGVESGVKGTPTFFINGQRYRGAVNLEAMSEAINNSLV
jgi:protein-disulfide isomerase